MAYLLVGLVLAIITASVVAWMKVTGGDEGVVDAELVDVDGLEAPPAPNDLPARHALDTVVSRHIPLLYVTKGPHLGQAWLHFADGTELLAEERVLGALGSLAFDLAWHGPTPAISPTTGPDSSDLRACWVTVGRLRTPLRVLDARHPAAFVPA